MIVVSSASFGFTPTNLGVTPVREVNPFTDVCCFVVARTNTPPASPARACDQSGVDNLCDLSVHLSEQPVRCHRHEYRGRRRQLQRVLNFLAL